MDNAKGNRPDPLAETKEFQSRFAQRASVYICYAPDDVDAAGRFCAEFESRGTPCWYSARDLTPAMAWPQCVVDAIETSKFFVLLLTESASNSRDIVPENRRGGWIRALYCCASGCGQDFQPRT